MLFMILLIHFIQYEISKFHIKPKLQFLILAGFGIEARQAPVW